MIYTAPSTIVQGKFGWIGFQFVGVPYQPKSLTSGSEQFLLRKCSCFLYLLTIKQQGTSPG